MKKILFIPLYDNHIWIFIPVIKQLQLRNSPEPLVIVLERVHTDGLTRTLDKYNLPYKKVDIFPGSFKGGQKLDVRTLTMEAMEKHLRTLIYTRRKIKRLFNELDPACVVTTNESYYADRFFLHEAKQVKIPSLSLFSVLLETKQAAPMKLGIMRKLYQKAYYLIHCFWSHLLRLYRCVLMAFGMPLYHIKAPSRGKATKVCVWNKLIKRQLIEKGGIPEKIMVTGSTAHDAIYHKESYFGQKTIDAIYELLKIDKGKGIILFTSQPFARDGYCSFEEQRNLTELIIETCARFDGYMLVIKLHPTESVKDYGYINGSPLRDRFRLVADKDADLYDLIYGSRLVLTQSSTTGVDAILFDKDVISVNILIESVVDYFKAGASLDVHQGSELSGALYKVLNDENVQEELRKGRRRFIAGYLPDFDGKAADRVIDLLYQLLNEKST